MYQILVNHQDGNGDQVIWDGSSSYQILSPTIHESIDETPTFDFTILPDHPQYDKIVKFKSTVSVKRGDTMLFYGRVLGDGADMYRQKKIACEGALSYLLDSVQTPVKSTKETPLASLTRIINVHNAQMGSESYKKFTIGTVNIDGYNTSDDFVISGYDQTRSIIESQLINEHHGYIRARRENGTTYIDWLKSYGRTNAQPIKMAVNLTDISKEELPDDYYTVMIPTGTNNKTIADANNGSIYLRDEDAIAKYGVIVHSESFDSKSAATIKSKGQKKFSKRAGGLPLSVTVKAIDMTLLGGSVDEILLGDVLTNVEGYTGNLTVVEIERNLFEPQNDSYTLENDTAIAKRHDSEGRKGTISSRSGGYGDALDTNRRQYQREFQWFRLQVEEDFSINAADIKLNADRLKIMAGLIDWESEEYKDYTTADKERVREYFTAWQHQTPKQITDTVQDLLGVRIGEDFKPVYKTNEDGSYVLDKDGCKIPVYIPGATVQSAQSFKNASSITDIVGTIGIQINKDTGLPFTDSNGNYINVELDEAGYPKVVDGKYVEIPFPAGCLRSRVTQTETAITQEVVDRTAADTTLRGAIEVNSNKVSMIVTAKDGGGYEINRAAIVAGINGTDSYVKIQADQVDLGDYATATTIEATYATVDSLNTLQGNFNTLVSGNSYAGNIMVNGFLSGENVYAIKQLSIGNGTNGGSGVLYYRGREYYRQGLVLGSGSPLIAEGHFLGESSETLNLNHYHDIDIEEVTTGTNAGRMKVTLGAAVATTDTTDHIAFFKIADTATYKAGIGIDTIESADGWTNDGEGGGYYNLVTATANDGDPDTNKTKTARVALPEITLVADADWSAAYKKSVNAYGPVVGQLTAAAPVAAALEIDASDVYTSGETAGKKSVTPSIATAGWRWEGTDGAEELHNKVTATNPNDSTKKTTVTVDPPTITVDMTASQIRAFASDGTNSYAVATANYTMTGDGLTVSLKNSAGTTVKSVTCADSYLKPENIKEDVTIFGVKGTHVGGGAVTSITQRITPAAYSNDDKEYTVYLRATGTNITAFDAVTIVDASEAYNHGCDSVMPVSATIA